MIGTPHQHSTTLVFHHFSITSFSLFAVDFSQKIIANDCIISLLRANLVHMISASFPQKFGGIINVFLFVYYLSLAASSNRITVKAIFTLIEFLDVVFAIRNTTHIQ